MLRRILKRKILRKILLFFLMILMVNSSYAVVDLFDQNRGTQPKPIKKKVKKAPKKVSRKSKKLNLSLVGLFKSHSTILYFKDMKNKSIRVRFDPNKKVALPGYPELMIEKIEDRMVYLKDKDLIYCTEDAKKGIACDKATGVLKMSMVRQYIASSRIKKSKASTNDRNNRANNRNNRNKQKRPVNRNSSSRSQSNPFARSKPR